MYVKKKFPKSLLLFRLNTNKQAKVYLPEPPFLHHEVSHLFYNRTK